MQDRRGEAGVPGWRGAPSRTRGAPRQCGIAADAPAQSSNNIAKSADHGTEANGSLLGRDRLLDRPGYEFAIPQSRYRVYPIAVNRDHRLVLRNGFFETLPRPQHLGFGKMRK